MSANQIKSSLAAESAVESAGRGVQAAVVNPIDGKESTYTMFEVRDITAEGAFLVGQLFFEVDEKFALHLSLGDDTPIIVRVRVVGLERANEPRMAIVFEGLSETDREALVGMAAQTAERDGEHHG